jgi:hypothetical protein
VPLIPASAAFLGVLFLYRLKTKNAANTRPNIRIPIPTPTATPMTGQLISFLFEDIAVLETVDVGKELGGSEREIVTVAGVDEVGFGDVVEVSFEDVVVVIEAEFDVRVNGVY